MLDETNDLGAAVTELADHPDTAHVVARDLAVLGVGFADRHRSDAAAFFRALCALVDPTDDGTLDELVDTVAGLSDATRAVIGQALWLRAEEAVTAGETASEPLWRSAARLVLRADDLAHYAASVGVGDDIDDNGEGELVDEGRRR